jgi:hypothetical protein
MRTAVLAAILTAAVAAAAAAPLAGGVVMTLDGRLEGPVALADGAVRVAGRGVAWADVVYVIPSASARTRSAAGAVHLAGGEVWRGDILTMTGGRLSVRPSIGPVRTLPAEAVLAIDFGGAGAGDAAAPPAGSGLLVRTGGEPLPGTLLWIDETRLAVDSPLGVVAVPRATAARYVFARPSPPRPPAADGADEVALVDGSLLRGRAAPRAGRLVLEHAAHGTLDLPAPAVRYVRRHVAGAVDLAAAAPASAATTGVFGPRAEPAVSVRRLAEPPGTGTDALATLRIEPKTTVTYAVAPGPGRRLVGRLRPLEGARGDVQVWIAAGGAVLDEVTLEPGSAPVPLALDLPPDARDLTVEVDFGRRLGFPCGVRIEDALYIAGEADKR